MALVSSVFLALSVIMASEYQEDGLRKEEFYDVQAFSKSSYMQLAAYVSQPHLKAKRTPSMIKDHKNPSYVPTVDPHLAKKQLPDVVSRGGVQEATPKEENEKPSCTPLRQYLLQVAQGEAAFPFTEGGEGDAVRNMMENAAYNFCEYLRKNFRLFQDCHLLKTGSTYEGVKIGKPDEFDFMIEVPVLALSDAVVFQQSLGFSSNGRIPYNVYNKALFSDIFEYEDSHFTRIGPVEQEAFMTVIFTKILHAVETKFIQFLPTGWEFIGVSDNLTTNPTVFALTGINAQARMALTPCFVWHGVLFPSLKVTVDFSFAIPIVKPAEGSVKEDLGLKNGATKQKGEITSEVKKYEQLNYPSFETREDVTPAGNEFLPKNRSMDDTKLVKSVCSGAAIFEWPESQSCGHHVQEEDPSLLIPDVFHLLLADFTWCRVSFSIEEQKVMKMFNTSDGQKVCMRLIKYLRDAFIAQVYDEKIRDLKPIISTYWLKTIMYYLYEKYRNITKAWEFDQLHHRILEVFQTLLDCLRQSSLHHFFVPNYNLLWVKQPHELQTVMNGVKSLLQLLNSLDKGEITIDQVEAQERKVMTENQKLLYEGRRSTLMEMLLTYGIYGTESDSDIDEELQSIHSFARQYLDGIAGHTVHITGKGQDILFFEDGLSVDIGIKEATAFLDEEREAFDTFVAEQNN